MTQSIRLTNYQIVRIHMVTNPSILGETMKTLCIQNIYKKQSFLNTLSETKRTDLLILSFSPICDDHFTYFLISTAPW